MRPLLTNVKRVAAVSTYGAPQYNEYMAAVVGVVYVVVIVVGRRHWDKKKTDRGGRSIN